MYSHTPQKYELMLDFHNPVRFRRLSQNCSEPAIALSDC
jgi:hypothetical protein